jgi:transposase
MPGEAAATIDLKSLPAEVTALIERLQQQAQADAQELARREREIALARVKIDKLNFELARLKRWKFDAKTESMTAAQRLLFADTLAEDEASLQAKLAELQARPARDPQDAEGAARQAASPGTARAPGTRRAPPRARGHHLPERRLRPADAAHRRGRQREARHRPGEVLRAPAHLRQVGLQVLPATAPGARRAGGGRRRHPGRRPGGAHADQPLRRSPAVLPAGADQRALGRAHAALDAGVLGRRRRRESLEPLFERQRCFILSGRVLHADETPLPLLDPGAGKTKKVYVWAWARSHHDPHPGVVYEFCLGRGAQYPVAFLGGKGPPSAEPVWNGTLITDQYAGYNAVLDAKVYPQRKAAACAAHARRRFEELSRGGHSASAVATEAMLRWTRIYRTEAAFAEMGCDERRRARQVLSRPLWEEFEIWLKLQRKQVPDGTKIAEAIDYSLNAWKGLTLHLDDGAVPIDNNLIERQIKPWKLGAKNWLFAGSALAGQRAAVVMSLVQSAKLNGLDPWAYLRDVLARIHTHPNHRLDELLPHRWRPA